MWGKAAAALALRCCWWQGRSTALLKLSARAEGSQLPLRSPLPLTLLLVKTVDLIGKARQGSTASVLPPYLSPLLQKDSEHNARGHQRQRHHAYAGVGDLIPAACACELSALRYNLFYGIQHPLQPHLLLLPSYEEQVERDRLQEQNCCSSF